MSQDAVIHGTAAYYIQIKLSTQHAAPKCFCMSEDTRYEKRLGGKAGV